MDEAIHMNATEQYFKCGAVCFDSISNTKIIFNFSHFKIRSERATLPSIYLTFVNKNTQFGLKY